MFEEFLPHDYPRRLQKLGIKCKMFAPIKPFVSTHYRMFLHMWYLDEKEKDFDRLLHVSAAPQPANGFVMPYGDCPLDRDKAGEQVYMDMLNRAQSYIHIMTPI